ncbi:MULTISPECIES: hypothetical protein [Pseudomonas]|uniref:hypothetical protein n=1 Tax=Pseudomonas TaxID=286 RepID=UPI000DB0DA6A|nr:MULTISPECIES: hypothetical protein [Pseudomonas]PZQ36162.1 MAG: hypothetical protein DI560_25600 [Pseudomonas putida]
MFNGDLKKNALEQLEKSRKRQVLLAAEVEKGCTELHGVRHQVSTDLMRKVEGYIETLANKPKEFEKSYQAFKAEGRSFCTLVDKLKIEADKVEFTAGSSAAAGVAAGVGTAAFAPTAAMAVATTFGTASTGAAISGLSGAAATNAALAWLGGGAIAAGGGGMSAGSALLALAGPIGWGIGATALVGGGLYARSKNKQIAEEADGHRAQIEVSIRKLNVAKEWVTRMIGSTVQHANGVSELLGVLVRTAPRNYQQFDTGQKDMLGALINHMNALGPLLNKAPQ